MTARLDPASQPWMGGAAVKRVMAALNAQGGDKARFVGGAVRNALMGRPVDDVDIATLLEPDAASAALEAAGIKVVPTGLDHGTVTAVANGEPFEVTSLRADVETFGRRAVVKFTTDWREDAGRRDFRLNAIYASPDGALFDPFDGIADALAGRVIFIGDPHERIAEDHLRILRFYRFNAWYGAAIDPAGQAACAAMAATLDALSAERVWKELKKLLAAPDPRAAIQAMHEGHALTRVIPGVLDFNELSSIILSDRGKSWAPDPLLRLAALVGRDENAMSAVLERMKASNAEQGRAHRLCAPLAALNVDRLEPTSSPDELARAVYRLDAGSVIGRLRLDEARGLGDATDAIAFVSAFERPHFPVKGADLLKAGFERGPSLGAMLERLETRWVASGFTLDRDALLALAAEGGA